MEDKSRYDFKEWPIDLLMDYALKIHHRGIRAKGPKTLELISKLKGKYPRLQQVEELFSMSLDALDTHLSKEENVLFLYIYHLYQAASNHLHAAPMHCGTVRNPISVMEADHAEELQRQESIAMMLNNYAVPQDADSEYNELMDQLKGFALDLKEHTHIENDIIFPTAEQLEADWVNYQTY